MTEDMKQSEAPASIYDLKRMAAAEMAKFATKDALNAAVVGNKAADLFMFSIDTATMQLCLTSTAAYAECFYIDENGYLCLDLDATT